MNIISDRLKEKKVQTASSNLDAKPPKTCMSKKQEI